MKGGWRSNAGRPGWHGTTDDAYEIDVRRLHRGGYLSAVHQMTWRWGEDATIRLRTSSDGVLLSYRYEARRGQWGVVEQFVAVIRTPCHFGGTRPWFSCPCCSKRVAILYLWNVPICRRCAQLVYASQNTDEIGRSWLRTWKIDGKLAGGAKAWDYRRPKRMRWATYWRLMERYGREIGIRDDMLVAYARGRFPEWF